MRAASSRAAQGLLGLGGLGREVAPCKAVISQHSEKAAVPTKGDRPLFEDNLKALLAPGVGEFCFEFFKGAAAKEGGVGGFDRLSGAEGFEVGGEARGSTAA